MAREFGVINLKLTFSNLVFRNVAQSNIAGFSYTANESSSRGEATKRIWFKVLRSDLASANDAGAKAFVAAHNISLLYQLATPIINPIDFDGLLPAGTTIRFEPVVADVGIYSTKFDILDTTRPISSIDRFYKVDFATGVSTLLTDAVVAGDGLSLTNASLAEGDLVNVLYYYATAYPEGLTTVEYLNSNVVIPDTVNGKYYEAVPIATNGVLSWGLEEVL